MAISTAFTFTNTSASTVTITVPNLGLTSTNYALVDGASDTQVVYTNLTAERTAPELLIYRSRPIENVNTRIKLNSPPPVKSGVQFTVELQAIAKTTDSDDPAFRVDNPTVVSLTVRDPNNDYVTDSLVDTMIKRLLGALYNPDGTFRFTSLRRGATRIY